MIIFAHLISSLFAFVSTYVAYHGIKHCFACARMYRAGLRAEGTVTQIKTNTMWRKGKLQVSYTAVIAFETAWREKREVDYADVSGADIFKVGDRMMLWYDETHPEVFAVGGWPMVKDIASFFIISGFLGIAGWGALYQTLKQYLQF